MRFRKCENWGWFKGLIILSEQPIMIQQIAVCQKFYLKPKINKNYQLTLYHNWIAKKCQNWKIWKTTFFDTRNNKELIKSSFSKSGIIEKTFFLVPIFYGIFAQKSCLHWHFCPRMLLFTDKMADGKSDLPGIRWFPIWTHSGICLLVQSPFLLHDVLLVPFRRFISPFYLLFESKRLVFSQIIW